MVFFLIILSLILAFFLWHRIRGGMIRSIVKYDLQTYFKTINEHSLSIEDAGGLVLSDHYQGEELKATLDQWQDACEHLGPCSERDLLESLVLIDCTNKLDIHPYDTDLRNQFEETYYRYTHERMPQKDGRRGVPYPSETESSSKAA